MTSEEAAITEEGRLPEKHNFCVTLWHVAPRSVVSVTMHVLSFET
jgi:hypothetical protein